MNTAEESCELPAEAIELLKDLTDYLRDIKTIKQELAHIQKPYSVPEIKKQYVSGSYNAELLLQHCLIHLSKLDGYLIR